MSFLPLYFPHLLAAVGASLQGLPLVQSIGLTLIACGVIAAIQLKD